MSETDPTKMKVVELRSELSTRGLDTKGIKSALVKRLKTALAKEAGAVADENGADTTEFDTTYESQEDESKNESQMDAEDEILKEDPVEEENQVDEAADEVKEDEILEDDAEEAEKEENEAPAEEANGDQTNDTENMETNEEKATEEGDADAAKVTKNGEDAKEGEEKSKSDEKKDSKSSDRDRHGRKRRYSGSRDRRRDDRAERKPEPPAPLEDLEEFDSNLVILDIYMSDLNLKLDATRTGATPLHNAGFAFMWAGAKGVYGVKEGKVCFEVKVTKKEDVKHLPTEEANPHVVRVGFSDVASGLQLGEEPLSYGYGGTGKFSSDCKFTDYGKTFSEGDVVQCFLDLDSEPMQLSYSVNGEHLGVAAEIKKEDLNDSALFPHILTKNCSFDVNFGQKEEQFFPLPEGFQDYVFMQAVEMEKRVRGPVCPEKKEDCEMIMMCGLPGAGKTHWALNHAKENPDKRYYILGTNSIIDRMKVMGLPRKRNYHGRWEVLIDKSTTCLNRMFDISFKRRRNYILDQTNVYASAQRRKMRPFEGFQRKAVVVVPTDDEFKARIEKRTKEEGKDVPSHAVLEMKANFTLPKVGELFSSVEFTELQEEEADKIVETYRKEGQDALPQRKKFRRDDRRSRDRRSGGGGPRDNRGPRGYSGNRRQPWSSGGGGNRSYGGGGDRNWSGGYGGGQGRSWSGGRDSYGQGRSWNQGPPDRRSWGSPGGRDSRDYRGYGGGGYSQGYGGQSGYSQGWSGQQRQWSSSGGGGQWNQGGYY